MRHGSHAHLNKSFEFKAHQRRSFGGQMNSRQQQAPSMGTKSDSREAHLSKTLNLWSKNSDLPQRVANSKVLVVGAGGIGCELLKVLVLSGFKNIEIVDLDTIDVSNLNRQFLFRREHVGKSKAMVAAEAVRKFNRSVDLKIVSHHGNIKDKKFGADFMQTFDLIFNALDNIEARRHVNRVCVAVDKPLIDGGTQGYDGQVVTIKHGVSACYDCESKPAPKGFAVCTIRSTPDKPIHCIVWAKHLFGLLFGVKDDINAITDGVDSMSSAADLLKKLYVDDINKLIGMEDLWKSRKPPTALDIASLRDTGGAAAVDRSTLNDHEVWSLRTICSIFEERYQELQKRQAEKGCLEFDKDDDAAMDFVLCASNLRAHVFNIEIQSSFRCKDIAGNIIPAIATTNAIIAGVMVLEAFKVIDGRIDDCKALYKHREPTGRKSLILIPSNPDRPNPDCPVCGGGSTVTLTINTSKTPFSFLLDRILKQELGLSEPLVDTGDNFFECWARFEDPGEERQFKDRLSKPLSDPSIGIAHNTELSVEDEGQRVKAKIVIFHSDEMDVEGEKQYTLSRRENAAAAAEAEAAAPSAGEKNAAETQHEVVEEDDDMVMIVENGSSSAAADGAADGEGKAQKRGREEADGGDDAAKRAKK